MAKKQLSSRLRRIFPSKKKSIKVFGLGLSKTGTTTLGVCLSNLGYRHTGFRADLLKALRDGDLAPIMEVIDSFDSFDDFPFALMYRELLSRYRDGARYILTIRRSPEAWLQSLKLHCQRQPVESIALRNMAYGFDFPHGFEKEFIAIYEDHIANVRKLFAENSVEHLLLEVCWEEEAHWQRLCDFLDQPEPSIPFPHANRGDSITADPGVRSANERRIEAWLEETGRASR